MSSSLSLPSAVRNVSSETSDLGLAEKSSTRPLSPAEEKLWIEHELEPTAANNVAVAIRFAGRLKVVALEQAIDEVIRRHESLRTAYRKHRGVVVACLENPCAFTLLPIDLGALPPEDRDAAVSRILRGEARRLWDLSTGNRLRARLLRLGPEEHILLLVTHRIACDAFSVRVLCSDLAALYDSYTRQRLSLLAELPASYASVLAKRRENLDTAEVERQFAFWKRVLGRVPEPLNVIADRPRPSSRTWASKESRFEISPDLVARLVVLGGSEETSLAMLLLAAWQSLLHRWTSQPEVLIGMPVSGHRADAESLVGALGNLLMMRADFGNDPSFREVLRQTRVFMTDALVNQDVPFERLVRALKLESRAGIESLSPVLFSQMPDPLEGLRFSDLTTTLVPIEVSVSPFDLHLNLQESTGLRGTLQYSTELFDENTAAALVRRYRMVLETISVRPDERISLLPLLSEPERTRIEVDWNAGSSKAERKNIVEQIEKHAEETPGRAAIILGDRALTYRQLVDAAGKLAETLRELRGKENPAVAIRGSDSVEMVMGILAALKAGTTYFLLDSKLSSDHTRQLLAAVKPRFLIGPGSLLNTGECKAGVGKGDLEVFEVKDSSPPTGNGTCGGTDLESNESVTCITHRWVRGRVITTMLSEANVLHLMASLEVLSEPAPSVWYVGEDATTGNSGLEWLWPLAQGGTLVMRSRSKAVDPLSIADLPVQLIGVPRRCCVTELREYSRPAEKENGVAVRPAGGDTSSSRPIDFSLFYFSSEATAPPKDRYRLLLEGARFADTHGFAAVWTPERHFHAFGGLYSNPSVTSAAVAMVTSNVQIRAGSVVLPLHHPVRVAEEWALVDNLSGGRVGVSFASGWHANDFIFAPEKFQERQQILVRDIDLVRRLWRGETVEVKDGTGQMVKVSILPRPIRAELPFWVTSSGKPETFRRAGELGGGVLTHLLGQTPADLAKKIAVYRTARSEAGHAGPGHVALMLHTFVGRDLETVRERVRRPFTNYLKDSIDLIQASAAAGLNPKDLSDEDREAVVSFAFDRYFDSSGFFGTPESCLEKLKQLKEIGVDELACLIDFGVQTEAVLDNLSLLDEVRRAGNPVEPVREAALPPEILGIEEIVCGKVLGEEESADLGTVLMENKVTHFLGTRAEVEGLLQESDGPKAVAALKKLLFTGDVSQSKIHEALQEYLSGELIHLCGQPETGGPVTAWSFDEKSLVGRFGKRLPGVELFIVDSRGNSVPVGVPGELLVGGKGVALRFANEASSRLELMNHSFACSKNSLFPTGQRARFLEDGTVEYLGDWVRPELIERSLLRHDRVSDAAVLVRQQGMEPPKVTAFVVAARSRVTTGGRLEPSCSLQQLQQDLTCLLADERLNAELLVVEAIPRMADGVLNRRLCSELRSSQSPGAFVAPRTPTEEAVAHIWREVLNAKILGVHDEFFEQGGHSLLFLQMLSRAREVFQLDLPLRDYWKLTTVEIFAKRIEESSGLAFVYPDVEDIDVRFSRAAGRA